MEIGRNSEFCRGRDASFQRAMPHLGSTQLRDLGHPHASPDISEGPQGGASQAGSLDGTIIREAPGDGLGVVVVLFTLLISPHRAEPVSISGSHLRAWLRPHPHSSSPSVATVLLGPHGLLPPHVLLQGSYGPCLLKVPASAVGTVVKLSLLLVKPS